MFSRTIYSMKTWSYLVITAVASAAVAGWAFSREDDPERGWLVPVGGVIMWWGNEKDIPPGFEICDGKHPSTKMAKLKTVKPDFRDRFPKGATSQHKDVAALADAIGGSHDFPAHHHGPGTLAAAGGAHEHTGGAHQHATEATDDDHGDGNAIGSGERDNARDDVTTRLGGGHTHGGGDHGHTFTGAIGNPTAPSGDQAIVGANQPAYAEIFFIIRVR